MKAALSIFLGLIIIACGFFLIEYFFSEQVFISFVPPVTQTASVSGPTNGLVGNWAFDEGSGTTAGDSSGAG